MRSGWVVCVVALVACSGPSVEVGDGPDAPLESPRRTPEATSPTGPTWHADVKPLLDVHCGTCHTAGGVGPFSLKTYDQAKAMAGLSLASIEAERMPPWQANVDCRHYDQERVLPAAGKAQFKAWVEAGMPEGDPADAPPIAEADLTRQPDIETTPFEQYVPDPARPDDYRCFPLDIEFDEDTFITGTEVVPGQRDIVHHVLVYLATPDEAARVQQLDDRDEGVGYTCYGGPGLNNVGPLAAWVPGMVPQHLPDDSAIFVPKGSRLVMQLHYNTLIAPPAPDLTTLQLFTSPTPRPFVIQTRPQADIGLYIPAGKARSENVIEFTHRGAEPMTVVAMGPHMHVLGTEIKVELQRAGGERECLVQIDDWDFNWQQTYRFRAGEEVVVQPGDTFVLTCVYDNSAANQTVVNGERLPPRDVRWGEGTLDEMCLNFIAVKSAFAPAAGRCADFDGCREACADPNTFGCMAECMSADQSCGQCMLGEIVGAGGCSRPDCIGTLAAAQDCFFGCYIGGAGLTSCMEDTCPAQLADIEACMNPKIAAGACDSAMAACVE